GPADHRRRRPEPAHAQPVDERERDPVRDADGLRHPRRDGRSPELGGAMTVVEDIIDYPAPRVPQRSFVVDPAFADVVEKEYMTVPIAGLTFGPNRYTVHVPTENTVLSLGWPSARWKTDLGITGYTDSHV